MAFKSDFISNYGLVKPTITTLTDTAASFVMTADDQTNMIIGTALTSAATISLPSVEEAAGKLYTFIVNGTPGAAITVQSQHGRRFVETFEGRIIVHNLTRDNQKLVLFCDGMTYHVVSKEPGGLWAGCPGLGDHAETYGFDVDFTDVGHLNNLFTSADDGGTGTNVAVDVVGGAVGLVTAAGDNDYHALTSGAETFKFAANKRVWAEARIRLTEAATNESAWWFGFSDTTNTTGGFQANAAGPLASYDGALIWKDEATMSIDFETSNAATQATGAALATFVTATWTTVGLYFDGTATTSTVTPYIDGTAYTVQNITLAGLAEMHFVIGVKAGPSNNAETLDIDYVKVVAER